MQNKKIMLFIASILLVSMACQTAGNLFNNDGNAAFEIPEIDPLLEPALGPGEASGDEPVFVSGTVPFTSPFFLSSATEPFVLLEDQAGFIARDELFVFPLEGQAMGPVWQIDDEAMGFSLSLPAVPQGTLVDLDNDSEEDKGVMVFAVAYWSNIWGGPFLEEREGTGWSSAHATTVTDPNLDYEITGGHLIIWAPDNHQAFSTGFGEDGLLFTEDDPIASVPAGYSIVDLNQEPFNIYKDAHPKFELLEGSTQVKDYSDLSYQEAFDKMFEKVSVEYPFTEDKNIDWDALYEKHAPQIEAASDDNEFHDALHNFTLDIPDTHVGMTFNNEIFGERYSGSLGMYLAELSDGRVVVAEVFSGTPAAAEGVEVGAEILSWEGQPIGQALDAVDPYFGPYSTEHDKRLDQLVFLTRYPPFTDVPFSYQNPGEGVKEVTLTTDIELESLFASLYYFNQDLVGLPIEAYTMENGLVYIKVNSFSEDQNLMAQVWNWHINKLIDEQLPGLILDMRENGGGSGGLASAFAGYFFEEEVIVSQNAYYSHESGEFEYGEHPGKVKPGPVYYGGDVAVLVGPDCVSACEGFSYWMTFNPNVIVLGHTPSNGAFGEVGRGQYAMPGEIDVQFPTGRPETPDGELLIENVGVVPDILVPVTLESATGEVDAVLDAAIDALLK